MTNKTLLAFLFCLGFGTVAHAEYKEVRCASIESVLQALHDQFHESVVMLGQDAESHTQLMMTMNPEDHDFTILQFNDTVACVLAMGRAGKQFELPAAKNTEKKPEKAM